MSSSVKKISVIIVNYNAGAFLIQCLESLQQVRDEVELNIWLVDNASSDGSFQKAIAKFPQIHPLKSQTNLGFAKANNLALRKIKNEFILILNPDTKILPGTLKFMLGFMSDHPDVGAASCKVEKADGSIDFASHRGFPTPWASFLYYILGDDSLYHLKKSDFFKSHPVDAISGAFFLTRKSVLEKVGLFDEDFFLYAEDIDLCWRIKQAKFKVMYVPEVKIIHYKGVTSGIKKHSQKLTTATAQSKINALNSFYQTMKIFYRKHLEKSYPFFINWLVYLGISLKWWLAKRSLSV